MCRPFARTLSAVQRETLLGLLAALITLICLLQLRVKRKQAQRICDLAGVGTPFVLQPNSSPDFSPNRFHPTVTQPRMAHLPLLPDDVLLGGRQGRPLFLEVRLHLHRNFQEIGSTDSEFAVEVLVISETLIVTLMRYFHFHASVLLIV